MKKSLTALFGALFISGAHAVPLCPVCTVAVGAGLEGARLLGLDDTITGVWTGALMLVLSFWTIKWLKNRGVQNGLWYLAVIVAYYALLVGVYFLPGMGFGTNTLWGIDKFMMGIISGTVVFYVAERMLHKSIRKNGGKSLFKFQKVIAPIGALFALCAVFAAIVYL